MTDLAKLVQDLPFQPGVYLWKDEKGEILYIGKAKELRKRVGSYLRNHSERRTWELMQQTRDLETIVTNTEREALILEATLIKKHQPKYNRALKDDRRHAWIRVDLNSRKPTFHVTREIEKDGARYFGPYRSTKKMERLLDTARKYIPVAMCADPTNVKRACMDFHIDRCVAPCEDRISDGEYRILVDQMCLYIDGQTDQLIDLFETQMALASENLQFEKAAELRDRITDVEIFMRRQKIVDAGGVNRDVLGISRTEEAALVEMLLIRGGRLIGQDHFYFEENMDSLDSEILTTFIEQFYFMLPKVHEEILLPVEIPDMEQLSTWLAETAGSPVKIIVPGKGKETELVEMANKNAYRQLRKILILGDSEEEIVNEGVKELKIALNLSRAPIHIEGFDIANIQGTDPTGSCVVFWNGEPNNHRYRMFRIRSKETPDDYAMMHEVVSRRYRGRLEEGKALPDLIIIDGGKGQLNVTLKALKELGLDYLNVVSVAKQEEILFTRDRMDGIELDLSSDAIRLVQRVRDEAHRFAQKYHHKLREKRFSGSILEESPGIGSKRRQSLLLAFGSYDKVRAASVDELAAVEGMSFSSAQALRKWIDEEDPV
ncbi:MAG: excinuclease ABC subunit UvrC [Candidatus Thorarchaeota archaeon]|nr:excinuclease ABC subunit UvrC [Candidatus Thorarchaeota archaeon]